MVNEVLITEKGDWRDIDTTYVDFELRFEEGEGSNIKFSVSKEKTTELLKGNTKKKP